MSLSTFLPKSSTRLETLLPRPKRTWRLPRKISPRPRLTWKKPKPTPARKRRPIRQWKNNLGRALPPKVRGPALPNRKPLSKGPNKNQPSREPHESINLLAFSVRVDNPNAKRKHRL